MPVLAGWTDLLRKVVKHAGGALALVARGDGAELRYQLRNKLRGVDLEFVSVAELGLSPDEAHFHSSSGGMICERVFRRLPIPPGSVALDLGSGKGGAVFSLGRLPFTEVVGVDISPGLIRVARENTEKLRLQNVRFVVASAADYTDLDQVTHVYMYNPFPCAVMEPVLANLAASLRRADRDLLVVYRNPLCSALLATSGLFAECRQIRPDDHEWHIYVHRSATNSRLPQAIAL